MLKSGQNFVPHKTFEIIFSYESYIQTKTYKSFEYAQSTKYYICCIFPQSYHISTGNETSCFVQFRDKLVKNTHLGFMD